MSGEELDFNNKETRAVIKYFSSLQGKAPKEIHAILTETLLKYAPSCATVKNWVAQFKRGDVSTCVAPRPWRPKTVTTPEIIQKIHELILEDRGISAKTIAEQLGISRDRVRSIILEDLDMRKLAAMRIPKCLKEDQKRQWCKSSEQILEFFCRYHNGFLSRLVAMDETWLYQYDPETKHIQWNGGIAAHSAPKIRVQKFAVKVLASIFWDQDCILLIDYLPKGQIINAEYCSYLLVQMKNILKKKRRRNVTKRLLYLHDNSPARRALAAQNKLAYLGFHFLDHPPYSQDLASSDDHLSLGLKKQMKGRRFSSEEEVIAAAETCLDGKCTDFFSFWVVYKC